MNAPANPQSPRRRHRITDRLRTWTSYAKKSRGLSARQLTQLRDEETKAERYTEGQLRDRADALRGLRDGKRDSEDTQFEFVGLVASAVKRSFGFQLHDVQLQALHAGARGTIAEMQTGEGKTVVTGAIAAVSLLQSDNVHVSTTNAYLAGRDLEELTPVFESLGISSGLLPDGNDVSASRAAYQQSITYGPGYQFGFDYLRDQVYLRQNRQNRLGVQTLNRIHGTDISTALRQSGAHPCAIVDEADSVMIDEAVTPLVISGNAREVEDPTAFRLAARIAGGLMEDVDFTIELPDQRIEINDDANTRCHQAIESLKDLALERPWKSYIRNALRARHVLRRDVDYVVREDKVQIVDQNTGRIFPDRTWQDGLHQAVEMKEKVTVESSPPSVAQISRQRYLLMYERLAGLTGTAASVMDEFRQTYKLPTLVIPTHRPSIRQNFAHRYFSDQSAKRRAIADEVLRRRHSEQPILIGTRTIEESLLLEESLNEVGLTPVVLNGMQDAAEAEIVAGAGHAGALTIATNMAGRGTDIKLDALGLAAGGLHVIGYSPNFSARIDRQLIGRGARQGQPGSSQFFISADDELVARYAPVLAKKIAAKTNRSGEANFSFDAQIASLQKKVESLHYANRQSMMRRDAWMDQVRESIDGE